MSFVNAKLDLDICVKNLLTTCVASYGDFYAVVQSNTFLNLTYHARNSFAVVGYSALYFRTCSQTIVKLPDTSDLPGCLVNSYETCRKANLLLKLCPLDYIFSSSLNKNFKLLDLLLNFYEKPQ